MRYHVDIEFDWDGTDVILDDVMNTLCDAIFIDSRLGDQDVCGRVVSPSDETSPE